jgi:hypothetical protein
MAWIEDDAGISLPVHSWLRSGIEVDRSNMPRSAGFDRHIELDL